MATNPTFGFATSAEIKTRLSIESTNTTHDTLIAALALSVSHAIERIAQRPLRRRAADITEVYSGGSILLQVRLFPIASITNIRESADRDFTTANAYEELAANEDYLLRSNEESGESGIIQRIDQDWMGHERTAPGQVRVVYNGGYLNDSGDTFAIPHDLRTACITQVAQELDQRKNPGRTSTAMRGVSIASGTSATHNPMSILPTVREIAESYRRPIAI